MQIILILAVATFILTVLLTKLFIKLMEKAHLGQYIRDYGPEIHAYKSGTPTMGGLVILLVFSISAISLFYFTNIASEKCWLLILGTLSFGLIGLLDDLISLFVKKASLGLKARYKLILQLLIACIFVILLLSWGLPNQIKIPFTPHKFSLGLLPYAFLTILVLLGTVNAANLADGLDGLVCGMCIIILLTYLLFIRSQPGIFELVVILIASLMGFLWFNFYPARVFLGDTGSFALGGFIGSLAVITETQLILPIIGAVFVAETLSVILQVSSFKLFGTRIFKISPLHHHFEKAKGVDYPFLLPNIEWAEPTIIVRFWIATAMFCLIGILAYHP